MRSIYLLLAVVGTAGPYSQFLPWLVEHGPNLPLLFTELVSTRMGAFFGFDVLISAVVLIIFISREGAKRNMQLLWVPIGASCVVGVSCGLPLFLYLRECHIGNVDSRD